MEKKEFYRILDEMNPGNGDSGKKSEIYFERISMAGLEEMHGYSVDERLYEFLEFRAFQSIDETRAYLEKLIQRSSGNAEERTGMYWFVRRKEDNKLIGTCSIVGINFERQSAEWGYGVDPNLWGHGYILEIQQMLKEFAFSALGLNRLEGITMIENQRTIASLLATGMKHEGTLRQYYCKEGVFHDAWKYAMLREDYFSEAHTGAKTGGRLFTEQETIDIIASVLDEETIDDNSTMHNTATWDSMAHMAIMVAIFEKANIQLSPIQISNATSVRLITDLINGKQQAQ